MRLTIDVIEKSASFLNAIGERELDLRGNKIGTIENLSATLNRHDAIDLCDNEIKRLENFPVLPRLTSLYVANNKIAYIQPDLGTRLPHLKTLALGHNELEDLDQFIDALKNCSHLKELILLENPISRKKHYRSSILLALPQLHTLDCVRVTRKVTYCLYPLLRYSLYSNPIFTHVHPCPFPSRSVKWPRLYLNHLLKPSAHDGV